ncbi:major outer membrane protein [Campylobacter troglodytis]|uniref:major outer membrane protein n=1 Tax=Campylobacter troglodytis TaxID=654363 RepID=UPI001159DED6|nr:major outer membrane protein [Campylobacter troglodytis]TQR54012.1 hypothetical protein DMC01_10645 [Campylobacter troglodytis]
MKLVKLSVVAAVAACSFVSAKPLEEAIKNVEISGHARYRYDTGIFKENSLTLNAGANAASHIQAHRYRVGLGVKTDIGDGFKIFGQVYYNHDRNNSFATGARNGSAGVQGANTSNPLVLRQAYLEYENADYGFSARFGRQELSTVWTEDLAGMVGKIFLKPVDGITVAAFAVDSIQGANTSDSSGNPTGWQVGDTDATNFRPYLSQQNGDLLTARLYKYNIYGAAVLTDFADLGLKLDLWGAYWQETANLWALKLNYTLPLGEDLSYTAKFSYLGNTLNKDFKTDTVPGQNGQLFDLRGQIKGYGFDARLGGIMFGNKKGYSIHTLEAMSGADLYIGREIFYQKGSWLSLAYGQSTYGYIGAGYTLPYDIRIGVQGVYGGTKSDKSIANTTAAANGTGSKTELVGELSWKINKNFDLSLWYSNLTTKAKRGLQNGADAKSVKDSVRFQAYYKF